MGAALGAQQTPVSVDQSSQNLYMGMHSIYSNFQPSSLKDGKKLQSDLLHKPYPVIFPPIINCGGPIPPVFQKLQQESEKISLNSIEKAQNNNSNSRTTIKRHYEEN